MTPENYATAQGSPIVLKSQIVQDEIDGPRQRKGMKTAADFIIRRNLRWTIEDCVGLLCCLVAFIGSGHCQDTPPFGTIEHIVVPAPSLEGNILGDPTSQKALIYLPAGYDKQSSRRYPVLYLLHGFSLGPVLDDWGEIAQSAMNSFAATDATQAYIVVIPNGANAVWESFYLILQLVAIGSVSSQRTWFAISTSIIGPCQIDEAEPLRGIPWVASLLYGSLCCIAISSVRRTR